MTSRNGLCKLPTQFLEKRKNVFELKDQKWSGNGPLNKKTSKNIWQSQKWFLEWVQKLKTNLDLQKTFDIALAQYLISKDFWNALAIFLTIYQSQKIKLYGWISTVSRRQSHYEETVYFLPQSFQEYPVLISSISEGWKVESTLGPLSDLESGVPELGIRHFND